MARRFALALLSVLLVPVTATAASKEIPTVRLNSDVEVAAPPAAVWAQLTTGKNLVTWCPMWKGAANRAVNLAKVGDVLDYTDSWGNGGHSIVTFIVKDKELRVAHEPNDGSYMCQARITLEPKGDHTIVRYTESYTDESGVEDRKATAEKTSTEMAATLENLKAQAEKK